MGAGGSSFQNWGGGCPVQAGTKGEADQAQDVLGRPGGGGFGA